MKLSELLEGSDLIGMIGGDTDIVDLCFDSRQVKRGYAFFCIEGNNTDGHDYVQDAVDNGAAAIVAQREVKAPVTVAMVKNTRRALSYAGANYYGKPASRMKLIGITGTNGKTTSTYMVKSILDAAGIKTGLIGTIACYAGEENLGSSLTTPEPLEMHGMFAQMENKGCKDVVMEVSSHAIAQKRISGLSYEIGAFTNLTQDHLDYHGSMDAYAYTKKKLFWRCKTGVFNIDDPMGEYMARDEDCEKLFYGMSEGAEIRAVDATVTSAGVVYTLVTPKGQVGIELAIPGEFSIYNSLCAAACCYAMNIDIRQIAEGLCKMEGVPGRIQPITPPGADYSVILDYAHTPDGLRNIISAVRGYSKGRIITVFGCGGDRDPDKRPKMGFAAGEGSDYCIITSDNPRTEDPMKIIEQILPGMIESGCAFEVIENRKAAIAKAMDIAKKDDVIILAGKGHEPYQEINHTRYQFDEKQIVLDTYNDR